MKKIICGLLAFGAFALSLFGTAALAEFDESKINSAAAILMEPKSGRVFFEKNSAKRLPPASTTKILTALIALETGKMDDKYTSGREINKFSKASSLMGLKEGEEVTLKDLLYGMMLASGNDAAATVGKTLGGSIEGFAKIMNEKAADIGMKDSHFINPYGTHEDEHYSTAYDMALLAAYAMQNEQFMKIVSAKEYTAKGSRHKEPILLKNTNKLVYYDTEKDDRDLRYKYATGMKTGLTDPAKGCLVASASRNGIDLVAVILGDASSKYSGRFEEARALFEYGFSNFAAVPLSELPISTDITAPVSGSSVPEDSIPISVTVGEQIVTGMKDEIESLREDASPIKAELHLDKELVAPIEEGAVVGTVAFRLGDEILAMVDAHAGREVLAAETAPVPTEMLVAQTASIKETGGSVNPLLYVVLVLLVLLLAVMVLRIIKLRRMSRKRRTARSGGRSDSQNYAARGARRRTSSSSRYHMYNSRR